MTRAVGARRLCTATISAIVLIKGRGALPKNRAGALRHPLLDFGAKEQPAPPDPK